MSFVLDVSVTLAWCFHDEATAATAEVLDRLRTEEAFVPSLWHLEVTNVLTLAERKNRIAVARTSEFVALLNTLPITVDEETPFRAFTEILGLVRAECLTSYDAAYLELAMRLGIPLATKDNALRKAAAKLGVEVLGV
ncbi:putative nucleic acid-binding protein [Skermanella aerolata]|jgi:predicted nucleic acid-binding protein|uniref:Ribonuclease VapC n=1 Tax=Skermanella aerolata TaxID=393310 RepID=A0A512DWB9_9PROT|nr:type II toxin-antitoxin system VapC family toxin [Skermanella aerolata]GEO40752.1 ribonuclease VapC [Skermanella aerolata]